MTIILVRHDGSMDQRCSSRGGEKAEDSEHDLKAELTGPAEHPNKEINAGERNQG